MRIVCWQTILIKYHTFLSKIGKTVTKCVVCCSRDWRFKSLAKYYFLWVVGWCALCCRFQRDVSLDRMKFASLEQIWVGGSHPLFLSPLSRNQYMTEILLTWTLKLNQNNLYQLDGSISYSWIIWCEFSFVFNF